jgi:hypothetical protein
VLRPWRQERNSLSKLHDRLRVGLALDSLRLAVGSDGGMPEDVPGGVVVALAHAHAHEREGGERCGRSTCLPR